MFWLESWQLDWMFVATGLGMVVLMLVATAMMRVGSLQARAGGGKRASR